MHVCLDKSALSLDKFSRWLRAICTILLARNSQSDRAKAINYVEQAASVMDDNSNGESTEEVSSRLYQRKGLHRLGCGLQIYPPDEAMWLLATTYNTGVECLAYRRHCLHLYRNSKLVFLTGDLFTTKLKDGLNVLRRFVDLYQMVHTGHRRQAYMSAH